MNRSIVLARYPEGEIRESDFALREHERPRVTEGSFVTRNLYFSMDAGFRQWMNADSGDNYLPGMQLEEPVQSIVLAEVVESRHADFPVGAIVSARTAWEEYSLVDGSDLCSVLEVNRDFPLHEYMSTLGPTGMTAWFGLYDIGRPQAGDVLLVSAAGGAVGTVVGQLGRKAGCHCIGLTSSEAKAQWLREEVGYHAAISRERYPDLPAALAEFAPGGIDVMFDNVGGAVLDAALGHLRERARIVLCGAIAQYESEKPQPVYNSWELITKRARAEGFMFSDYAAQFPTAIDGLGACLQEGTVKSFNQLYEGLEQAPRAFCDMLRGASRGKCLVRVAPD